METLVLMGLDIPLAAIRSQIASAIDIVIHLARMRDGSRKVVEISEICGIKQGEIQVEPIYAYHYEHGLQRTNYNMVNQEKLQKSHAQEGCV